MTGPPEPRLLRPGPPNTSGAPREARTENAHVAWSRWSIILHEPLAARNPAPFCGQAEAPEREITTERLLLREFTDDDAPPFLAYQADPRYAEFYVPGEAGPDHGRELLRLLSRWASERPRRNCQLALAALRTPWGLLGCCGLRLEGLGAGTAELGLELAPWGWGHGYATEAARALLGFGFCELRLDEVRGVSVSANVRVVALAHPIGFVAIGTRPGPAWMRARGWNQTGWHLTRQRWDGMAAGRSAARA